MNSHWILTKIPFAFSRFSNFFIATLCLGIIYFVTTAIVARSARQSPSSVFLDAPAAIYAPDPNDSWNKIFFYLFSRRVETRVTDEFPEFREATAFTRSEDPRAVMLPSPVGISDRAFTRDEVGDRAIDPLYPSFFRQAGVKAVLNDPQYSELLKALRQALAENEPRSSAARALMLSDLWSAYDTLFATSFSHWPPADAERRSALTGLLARMIRKIALTDQEIQSLPANYPAAAQRESLPDLFRKDGEWLEVRWRPHLHDHEAGYRRVTRIFLKPAHPPQDVAVFINALPRDEHLSADLDGVAIITQLLVIDAEGRLMPTSLTTEVQVRLFERRPESSFKKTSLRVSEISRRLLINGDPSGGLVAENENSPAYLATAGNDYTFASVQPRFDMPVQATLRTRCTACHGENLATVMTFAFIIDPNRPMPPVQQLNPFAHQDADSVMEKKAKQKDFESLRAFFDTSQ